MGVRFWAASRILKFPSQFELERNTNMVLDYIGIMLHMQAWCDVLRETNLK